MKRPRQKSFSSATSSSHAPFCPSDISTHDSTKHFRAASFPNQPLYDLPSNHHRSKLWVSAFKLNSNAVPAEPKSGWEKEGSAGGTLLRKMKKTLVSVVDGDSSSYSDPASYYPRPPDSRRGSGLGVRPVSIVQSAAQAFLPDRMDDEEEEVLIVKSPQVQQVREDSPPPAPTPILPSEAPISVFPSIPRQDRRKGFTSGGGAIAEWQAELADIESNWRRQSSQSTPESSPRKRRLSTGSRPRIIPHLHEGNVVTDGMEAAEFDSPPKKVLATSSSVPENLNHIWDDFLAEAELTFDEDQSGDFGRSERPLSAIRLSTSSLTSSPARSSSSSLLAKSPPVSPSKQSPKRRSNRHSVLVNPLPAYPTQYLDSLLPPSPTKKLLFPPSGAPHDSTDNEEDQSGGSELFLSAFPSPPLAAASVFLPPLPRPQSDLSDFQGLPRPVSGVSSLAERRSKSIPALSIAPRSLHLETDSTRWLSSDPVSAGTGYKSNSTANVTDRSYFSPATPMSSELHGDRSPWSRPNSPSCLSSASEVDQDRTMTLPTLRGLAIIGSQVDLLDVDPGLPVPSSSSTPLSKLLLSELESSSSSVSSMNIEQDHLALHRALDSVFSPFSTPSLGGSSSSSASRSSDPGSDTEFSLSPYANSDVGSFVTTPSSMGINSSKTDRMGLGVFPPTIITSSIPESSSSASSTSSSHDDAWAYAERQLDRAEANLPPFLSDMEESDFGSPLPSERMVFQPRSSNLNPEHSNKLRRSEMELEVFRGSLSRSWRSEFGVGGKLSVNGPNTGGRVRLAKEVENWEIEELAEHVVEFGVAF